jgi:DNA-binding NarL/FixJ family response regulator
VLIVDDDTLRLNAVGRLLRAYGFYVFSSETGRQALHLADHCEPDVALVDLRLPDLSGVEVIRQLSCSHPRTVSVLVTGFGTYESAIDAIRAGARLLAAKPLLGNELLALVDRALCSSTTNTETKDPSRDAVSGGTNYDGRREVYALARWAITVTRLLDSRRDTRTLAEWGTEVAASAGTIRNWCYSAGLSPRKSLLFARMLRAVYQHADGGSRPENLLNFVDRRTLARLLLQGGGTRDALPGTVADFLERQRIVDSPEAVGQIRVELARRKP